jgi:hypothetical protein
MGFRPVLRARTTTSTPQGKNVFMISIGSLALLTTPSCPTISRDHHDGTHLSGKKTADVTLRTIPHSEGLNDRYLMLKSWRTVPIRMNYR